MNSSTIVTPQYQKTTLPVNKDTNFRPPLAICQSIAKPYSNRSKSLILKEKSTSFWCITKNSSQKNSDIGFCMNKSGSNQLIVHFTPIRLVFSVNKTSLWYKNYETSWKIVQKLTNKNSMTPMNPVKSSKNKSKPSLKSSNN